MASELPDGLTWATDDWGDVWLYVGSKRVATLYERESDRYELTLNTRIEFTSEQRAKQHAIVAVLALRGELPPAVRDVLQRARKLATLTAVTQVDAALAGDIDALLGQEAE